MVRHRAETAADEKFEPAPAVFDLRQCAHVVHVDQAARFAFATRESDFEFSSEILCVRMAEQEIGERFGIRRDVERFGATDAGNRTGGDIAN